MQVARRSPGPGPPLGATVQAAGVPMEAAPDDPNDLLRFVQPKPIPQILHSVYEKGPFRTCCVCSQVLTDGRIYEIQKVYRGKEAIFEMAICHECGSDVASEFSKESMESMKNFMLERFKPLQEPTHCNFCGFPKAVVPNFTIVGMCREKSLLVPGIIMCEKCSESLQEKLSRKTREAQGDFVRDTFPGVPEGLDVTPAPSFGIL
jgi:hypothetical protein